MAYTPVGPFVNDTSPYISAGNLNIIEAGIVAAADAADAAYTMAAGAAAGLRRW